MSIVFELLKAILYGIVEGITEWLPISSTGHLILVEDWLPFAFSSDPVFVAEFWEMFQVVIQLGAILAVPVLFFDKLNMNVGLLKLAPGTQSEVVKFMVDNHDGLIIESFGVGGLPEYSDFYNIIRDAADSGKVIIMTTQVPNEGSDLTVYHVGGHLKNTVRLLEAYDMTTEAAYAKLMWIMGETSDFDEMKRLFYTPVAKDIIRSDIEE